MNKYVDEIVAALFEKAGDSEDVRALREEISDNCLEHFNDLIARGLSPEEAAFEIRESLKGMEEVIDEIARSNDAGEKTADKEQSKELLSIEKGDSAATAESALAVSMNLIGADRDKTDFGADGIRRAEFESSSVDLSIEPSPDGAIHLIPDPDDGSIVVSTQVKDGVLRITAERSENDRITANNSVGGTIAKFLKRAFSGVSITIGSAALRLLMPESAIGISARTKSGDIRLSGIATPDLKLFSVSGDMSVSPEGKTGSCVLDTQSGDLSFKGNAATFSASSASGDISLRGDFENCCAQSRSGDVNADIFSEKASLYTTSGDIEVNCKAGSLEINSTSGDIEASALFEEGTFSTTSGDIALRAEDSLLLKRVSVNTVSGDALVCLPAGLNAHVNFTSVSGDSNNTHSGGAIGDAFVSLRSVSGDLTVR